MEQQSALAVIGEYAETDEYRMFNSETVKTAESKKHGQRRVEGYPVTVRQKN